MKPSLSQESEKLVLSWMRHEAGVLRDYLVAGVEDPRANLQSILSRHFLVRALTADRYAVLMEHEYRFAAAMNWLIKLATEGGGEEDLASVLYALRQGGDNAEGIEIPPFIVRTFALLPVTASGQTVPNYVESFLSGARFANGQARLPEPTLDLFCQLWRAALTEAPSAASPLSVLEPACGSANDYRCLDACGIARLVDYTGFDLCPKNVENARALFPGVRFETGNAFEIAAQDKSFDLCFVHDLFEHLSLEGLETAASEICRVIRRGICAGFFNLDEIPEHRVRPVQDYFWNTLSLARIKELFARHGFAARVLHIGTFLARQTGCNRTHNRNAYTLLLSPSSS